jgi:hypothetical protein
VIWTTAEAVELCRLLYPICAALGCYPALTGGLLYKDGPRKDCDILFYRNRQAPVIDTEKLFNSLHATGLRFVSGTGWCIKATWRGKPVDCFFPEHDGVYETVSQPLELVFE